MRRIVVGLVAVATLLAACTPQPSAPSASPTVAPVVVTERTAAEIEAVMQRRTEALGKRDLEGYQKTFDGARLALRRCLTESFDIASRQGVSAAPKVSKVEKYGDQYVRAYVGEFQGYRRLYFRRDGNTWIQTEPKDNELGGEKSKTVDGLQVSYWGIDEDVVDALAKATIQARTYVLANLLSTESREPFAIRFYPTRSVAGLVGCSVVGTHLTNNPTDPYIRFYRYWFDATGAALTPDTITFIQHEGLHWAQDQYIPAITVRLPWFLVEGWPDYIGKSRAPGAIRNVLCNTPTPTFKQLSDGYPETPETPPELFAQYYSFANTMVEYLYERFGNDAYARLLTVYKDGVNAEVNFPKVLGVTPAQFYDGWLASAKRKYC